MWGFNHKSKNTIEVRGIINQSNRRFCAYYNQLVIEYTCEHLTLTLYHVVTKNLIKRFTNLIFIFQWDEIIQKPMMKLNMDDGIKWSLIIIMSYLWGLLDITNMWQGYNEKESSKILVVENAQDIDIKIIAKFFIEIYMFWNKY